MDQIETTLASLAAVLPQVNVAVLDFETSDVRPRIAAVAGLGIYLPSLDRYWYINCGHTLTDARYPRMLVADLAAVIAPFLLQQHNRLIAHNANYELRVLMRMGITALCQVSDSLIHTHRCDENLVAAQGVVKTYLPRVSYGLKELTEIYFNERPQTLHDVIGKKNTIFSPVHEVANYCAMDCLNTWRLYQRAHGILSSNATLSSLVNDIDDPNNIVISKMLWQGVGIDATEAHNQSEIYADAIQKCREEIWQRVNAAWSLETPNDIRYLLRQLNLAPDLGYDPFYFPLYEWENEPSIAGDVLLNVLEQCTDQNKATIIALVLWKWRMQQRRSAFLDALPPKLHHGRLHCDRFSSTLVTTRFSCSPNVQNLPGRADTVNTDDPDSWENLVPPHCRQNLQTRNIFVAAPGRMLVSMDLSAAEPRYLALLFEQALHIKEQDYAVRKTHLHQLRFGRYPALMAQMRSTATHSTYVPPVPITWPTYAHDPLWQVFNNNLDPYNALMQTMRPNEYAAAVAQGQSQVDEWLDDNRWRSKLAFLALGYGASADTLAPQLKWTVEETEDALASLEANYQTLAPLRELTMQEVLHLGEVRSLFGRPRRLNGYYQLTHPDPVTIRFYRMRPTNRTYEARIIPLGTTRYGVQCLVEECAIIRDDDTKEIVLSCSHNSGGAYNVHADYHDVFVGNTDQFNNVPFRNINYSQIIWVKDANGVQRPVDKQQRALRQAFNAKCQMTGADHIRWLMNRIDQQVIPHFPDCYLVLMVHDSLVFEVPESQLLPFIVAAYPVMTTRPSWSDINFRIKVEFGQRFGDMTTWHPPQ